MMMIHNPVGGQFGEAKDLRKHADLLDKIKINIIQTYMEKTKKAESEIATMMDAETWMNGEEAYNFGFADIIDHKKEVKACYSGNNIIVNGSEVNIDSFKNFPKNKIVSNEKKQTANHLHRNYIDRDIENLQNFIDGGLNGCKVTRVA
jgi:hypothetical protein